MISKEHIGLPVHNNYGSVIVVGSIYSPEQFCSTDGQLFWRSGWRVTDDIKALVKERDELRAMCEELFKNLSVECSECRHAKHCAVAFRNRCAHRKTCSTGIVLNKYEAMNNGDNDG